MKYYININYLQLFLHHFSQPDKTFLLLIYSNLSLYSPYLLGLSFSVSAASTLF